MLLQKNDMVRRAGDVEGSLCPIGFVRKVDKKNCRVLVSWVTSSGSALAGAEWCATKGRGSNRVVLASHRLQDMRTQNYRGYEAIKPDPEQPKGVAS